MLFDFKIFYAVGQAVLAGESPYTVAGFFYPLPVAYFLALWALLPFKAAIALWWAIQLAVLGLVARRAAPLWLAFPPVFQQFFSGNLDLFILGLWRLAWNGSATALAVSTLKPHLGLLVVPYLLWQWRGQPRRLLIFACSLLLIYGPFFILSPAWVREWLIARREVWSAMSVAPSVFGLVELSRWLLPVSIGLAALVAVLVWRGGWRVVKIGSLAISPAIQPYNYALLAGPVFRKWTWTAGWFGWLAFLLTGDSKWSLVVPAVALWEENGRIGEIRNCVGPFGRITYEQTERITTDLGTPRQPA